MEKIILTGEELPAPFIDIEKTYERAKYKE